MPQPSRARRAAKLKLRDQALGLYFKTTCEGSADATEGELEGVDDFIENDNGDCY